MKVIQIVEENHGHIGTAVSMKAAFQYLVEADWLTFSTDVWLFDSWVAISDIFEQNGWQQTKEELVYWALHHNPELWDGMFYFSEDELIEED